MFNPFDLRGITLSNRVVVSPMDMYCAVDGTPTEWHLVHYGSRAMGGAGFIVAEDAAVSESGRITPGCTGLYRDDHVAAWRRITDFVHEHTNTKIGVQIGHSGRRGSTKRMYHGQDDPLPEGNWEGIAPSAIPYGDGNQIPTAMDQEAIDKVQKDFIQAAVNAAAAGFDAIELHCAHGYLLSGFLSPIGNKRKDEFGGEIANRLRFPLTTFNAMREVFPDELPIGVRISASALAAGGTAAAILVGDHKVGHPSVGSGSDMGSAFLGEMVGTCLVVLVVLGTATVESTRDNMYFALASGFAILGAGAAVGGASGGCFNPAVGLLVFVSDSNLADAWIYWVAPPIGALFGLMAFRFGYYDDVAAEELGGVSKPDSSVGEGYAALA